VHLMESSKDDIALQILDQVPALRSRRLIAHEVR
jgi:hypothetical protein